MNMALLHESLIVNILSFIFVSVVFLYYFSIKTFNYWKTRNVKYVKPVPFFGNTLLTTFRKISPAYNYQEIYNMYPKERVVGMFMFRTPLLMVRDPQLIHCIMSKDFVHFYDRGITVDERLDLLSLHLVNLTGKRWKSLRSKLTPSFSSGKLKAMGPLLEECASSLSDCLGSVNGSNNPQDITEVMAKFATDVIGSCAFGLQFNTLKEPDSLFRKMGKEVFKPSLRFLLKFIARTFHPSLPYYLNLKALHPKVEQFFLDFVKDAVDSREKNPTDRKDFLHLLIEMKKDDVATKGSPGENFELSEQILASNIFVFFLAGFETTSATMSFLLLELAANPKIQESMREEIVLALQNHNGELNPDTIKELLYTEMVISETLRKYPIAIGILRQCTENYQVPDSSLVIEKGTKILIPAFALQHDPSYYTNPEVFDPERFSPENKAKIVQGTYLPFGEGPRICIGLRFAMMEMKYAFCKIMPKYEFTLPDETSYPVKFRKGSPLLGPEEGIKLNIHYRSV